VRPAAPARRGCRSSRAALELYEQKGKRRLSGRNARAALAAPRLNRAAGLCGSKPLALLDADGQGRSCPQGRGLQITVSVAIGAGGPTRGWVVDGGRTGLPSSRRPQRDRCDELCETTAMDMSFPDRPPIENRMHLLFGGGRRRRAALRDGRLPPRLSGRAVSPSRSTRRARGCGPCGRPGSSTSLKRRAFGEDRRRFGRGSTAISVQRHVAQLRRGGKTRHQSPGLPASGQGRGTRPR